MKYRVEYAHWIAGSGWSYNTTIDNVDELHTADDLSTYAEYTQNDGDEIRLIDNDNNEIVAVWERNDDEAKKISGPIRTIAYGLYAGGWRSEDKQDLILEYDLTEKDAEDICGILLQCEEDEQENEAEALIKAVANAEEKGARAYVFEALSKSGSGHEQTYKTADEAIKAADNWWRYLTQNERERMLLCHVYAIGLSPWQEEASDETALNHWIADIKDYIGRR